MKENTHNESPFIDYKDDVETYFYDNPGGYEMYYVKDLPTSRITRAHSLLHYPQNFQFAFKVIKALGEEESKRLINLMIEASGKYHMGYDKPEYEKYIEFETFNDKQRYLFDWVKTYAFVRRYSEFLQDQPKYLHPILLHDEHPKQSFPRIHPGTARLRCTEFLWQSQRRDILIDIIYYCKHQACKLDLEDKLKVKFQKINNFDEYLRLYGYASMEMFNRVPKTMRFDTDYKIGWPEYFHFLKSDQYIPYLYEAYYHLFEIKKWDII